MRRDTSQAADGCGETVKHTSMYRYDQDGNVYFRSEATENALEAADALSNLLLDPLTYYWTHRVFPRRDACTTLGRWCSDAGEGAVEDFWYQ